MTRDEKSRNAYKRMWRNLRNYDRAIDQMAVLDEQADRSLRLAIRAMNDMHDDMRLEKV